MALLQVMAGAKQGGAEAFFVRLARGLASTEIRQRAIIRSDSRRRSLLEAAGVEVEELPFGGMTDFGTRRGLRRAIEAFSPTVIMTWMNRATAKLPPRGAGQNHVHVARLGGYYDLKYYKRCDHLVLNTDDLRRYVIGAGWPEDRAHVLPNFVDETKALPVPRDQFDTPDDAVVLFALGRLHRNKGFDTLLKSLARVDADERIYLWLAGEGPERTRLEALAYSLGLRDRVRFLGWREDVAGLFAAADLFVCPSRHEPLGNVVLEAWAQEKAVVATTSQGPGAMIADGETGLLVPVDDVDALADAIQRAVRDPSARTRLAEAASTRYRSEFSQDRVVGLYLDFFSRVTPCAA